MPLRLARERFSCAQRLAASQVLSRNDVLDGARREPGAQRLAASQVLSQLHAERDQQAPPSAQRLAASQVLSLKSDNPPRSRMRVLNASRHHRYFHLRLDRSAVAG